MDDMDEAIVATAISKPKFVLSTNKATSQEQSGSSKPIILNSMALSMKRKSFKIEVEDDGRDLKQLKSSSKEDL